MNNSESKKRLLALQKSKFLSEEIPYTLRFAIEKISDAERRDAQIPKPVMANKRWSQAEEDQPVESLLAGNSIELIAANLARSTNSVFSRLHNNRLTCKLSRDVGLAQHISPVFTSALHIAHMLCCPVAVMVTAPIALATVTKQ